MTKSSFVNSGDLLNNSASPFLKWAGGKGQLLSILNSNFPKELINGKIDTYIEPFVGGGAVFFDIVNRFDIKKAHLFDINKDITMLYSIVKEDVEALITILEQLSENFIGLDREKREQFFHTIRTAYNSPQDLSHHKNLIERCAQTLFLNRTCFNGLYRVNKRGFFNVPFGKYDNPAIINAEKLRSASKALKIASIEQGDFSDIKKYITDKTFIYYDPPYRPLNSTSNFKSYSNIDFDDVQQKRLALFFKEMDKRGVLQLLSNSDPTNYEDDPFFDTLYADFHIQRIQAKRLINSKAEKRGSLSEILVRNY